jgi:hypothetical protein
MLWKIKKKMDLFWKSSNSWIFHPFLTKNCWQLLPQIYILPFLWKSIFPTLDRSQTTCDSFDLRFCSQNPLALFVVQIHHGPLLCTWFPKKTDLNSPVAIIAISIWWQPQTSTLCQKNTRFFQWLAWLQRFFKLVRLAADIKCVENVPKDLIGV